MKKIAGVIAGVALFLGAENAWSGCQKLAAPPPIRAVYSNLDKHRGYDPLDGRTVSGKYSEDGRVLAQAMPFIPTRSAWVIKIMVAASHVSGTNGALISVNADADGLPGAVLAEGYFSDLPAFGTNCDTADLHLRNQRSLLLVGGTRYWVVMKTNKKSVDASDRWNLNIVDYSDHTYAVYSDGAWSLTSGRLAAFKVLSVGR